jgi:glycosyltransferase involved in cell wall biosynthesis
MTDGIPRVSVVIPTFNYAAFLPRALDSVLAQSYVDYEIIVVDDGSTDETPQVASRYDHAIRYVHKQNGGVSSARNLGIELARGDLIAFLDADDEWQPQKLARQVAFMDADATIGMSYTDMSHWVDGVEVNHSYLHERAYRHVSSGKIFDHLLQECFIFVPTVMVRRECLGKAGVFDPALSNSEDHDLWLRIARLFEIGFLDVPLTIRHEHGAGATTHRGRFHTGQIQMYRKVLHDSQAEAFRHVARQKLAEAHWHLGYHLFSVGDMSGCREHMMQSMAQGGGVSGALKYFLLSCIPGRGREILRILSGRGSAKG